MFGIKLKSNQDIIYWINLSWNFLIINSILTPFYLKNGMNFHQIAIVSTVFSFVLLIADIPMGVFADQVGIKSSLLIAGFLKGTGGLILFLGHQFEHFIAAFVVIGLANAMYSGSDIKLLLSDSKNEKHSKFRKRIIFAQLGTAASSVVGSILVKEQDFSVPMLMNAICAWIPFVLSLYLQDLPAHFKSKAGYLKGLLEAVCDFKIQFSKSGFFKWAFYSRVYFTLIVAIHIAFLQGVLGKLGIPVRYFGFIMFVNSLFLISGSYFSRHIIRKNIFSAESIVFLLITISLAAVAGADYLGVTVLIFLGAIEFSRGLGPVLFITVFNQGLPVRSMTAVNSICTTVGSLLVVLFLPLVGRAIDSYGFQNTYAAMLVCSIPVMIYLALGFYQQRKIYAVSKINC